MRVEEFVSEFKTKHIQNTRTDNTIVGKYIRETLAVKKYLPFREKRQIVELVVASNIHEVGGIKRSDCMNEYLGFVVAMLRAHTSLQFSSDPVADYDLLAESGLLPLVIEEFRESYDECDVLLKMARTSELADNEVNVLVGKFLNGVLQKLDNIGETFKQQTDASEIQKTINANFKQEDLAKLQGFLEQYNK